MNLYNITNKTSAQHLGIFPGRDAGEALDEALSAAGLSCRLTAAMDRGVTVEQLVAEYTVEAYDYADDLATLAAAMVDDDRASGECTADVLDDPDAGSSDHWDDRGVYGTAALVGLTRATVDAIGWYAIRDAYAAAWREAVELELASRDDADSDDSDDGGALASAGMGTDEDYGYDGGDEVAS